MWRNPMERDLYYWRRGERQEIKRAFTHNVPDDNFIRQTVPVWSQLMKSLSVFLIHKVSIS
jgi:hypothetical protein